MRAIATLFDLDIIVGPELVRETTFEATGAFVDVFHNGALIGSGAFDQEIQIGTDATAGDVDQYELRYRVEGTYSQTYSLDFNLEFQASAGEVELGFGEVEFSQDAGGTNRQGLSGTSVDFGGFDIDEFLQDLGLITGNDLATLFTIDLGTFDRDVVLNGGGDTITVETIDASEVPDGTPADGVAFVDANDPEFDPNGPPDEDVFVVGSADSIVTAEIFADESDVVFYEGSKRQDRASPPFRTI